MRVGGEHEVEVTELDDDAVGTTSIHGGTLKIPGVAVGDRVRVRVAHVSPHRPVAWCEVTEVLSRGPGFATPPCSDAASRGGLCGGCPAMHLNAAETERFKAAAVLRAMTKLGISASVSFHSAADFVGYRNRGHFAASRDLSGRIFLGGFAARSREIVELKECLVLRPAIRTAARTITSVLNAIDFPVHPEPEGLRYVTLRASREGTVIADLVFTAVASQRLGALADRLARDCGIWGASYSINDKSGNALRIAPSKALFGLQSIEETLGPVTLHLGAAAFSQLNSDTAAAMYTRAASLCPRVSALWDLYCGAGGLGLTVLKSQGPSTRLYGVECSVDAVASARTNASEFGARAVFAVANLQAGVPAHPFVPEAILLNPPRKGVDEAVMRAVIASSAETLVYMSCNPKSFARDAAVLTAAGFSMENIDAYDMLPATAHVEIIARFAR